MGFPVYPTSCLFLRLAGINNNLYNVEDAPAKIHLFTNDVEPDANSVVASFTEAAYAGYAAQELVVAGDTLNNQGMVIMQCELTNFPRVGATEPVTCYGIYITNEAGTELLAAQRFDLPQLQGGIYPTAITGVWRSSEPLTSFGWIDVEA